MKNDADNLIAEITAYCEAAGISPSTLSMRALGSSRFMMRLKRKVEKLEQDQRKLRTYMADNPPRSRVARDRGGDEGYR